METAHLKLQFRRLVRHRNSAEKNSDEISFLDLIHCLRIWGDMKNEVQQFLDVNSANPRFENKIIDRRLAKLLKSSNYTFIPIPSGSGTEVGSMGNIVISHEVLSAEQIKKLYEMGPPSSSKTALTFPQWLNSEILETKSRTGNVTKRIGISREMLIKRVANFLGASHPAGMESSREFENRFDPYIREMHEIYILDGIKLTYYQLLEIADQIIEKLTPNLKSE